MSGLKLLRLRWLLFRGYKFYRWGLTAWSWDGELPPAFGYYPSVRLKKGLSIKEIHFRKLAQTSRDDAEKLGREILEFISENG